MAATPKPVRKMVKRALTHQRKEHKEDAKELSTHKHREFYYGPKAMKGYAHKTRKVIREIGIAAGKKHGKSHKS